MSPVVLSILCYGALVIATMAGSLALLRRHLYEYAAFALSFFTLCLRAFIGAMARGGWTRPQPWITDERLIAANALALFLGFTTAVTVAIRRDDLLRRKEKES